jgi:hypothetical protein
VCVEVDRMDNPANWRCVIAWGEFQELAGAEAEAAMRQLVARFKPLITSTTAAPSHGTPEHPADPAAATKDLTRKKAVIYRIKLSEKTGRFERR